MDTMVRASLAHPICAPARSSLARVGSRGKSTICRPIGVRAPARGTTDSWFVCLPSGRVCVCVPTSSRCPFSLVVCVGRHTRLVHAPSHWSYVQLLAKCPEPPFSSSYNVTFLSSPFSSSYNVTFLSSPFSSSYNVTFLSSPFSSSYNITFLSSPHTFPWEEVGQPITTRQN